MHAPLVAPRAQATAHACIRHTSQLHERDHTSQLYGHQLWLVRVYVSNKAY